jgi:hypothetical protein
MPYNPPPSNQSLVFSDVGAWVPFGTYAPGNFRTEPNGDRRLVSGAYQAGATYGTIDTVHSFLVTPAGITQAVADARYSPIGTNYREVAVWTGDDLSVGYEADANGIDMVSAGAIHAICGIMNLPPEGADLHCDIWQMVGATSVESVVATIVVTAGTVYGALNPLGADINFADGDSFRAVITQVGSTYAGQGLKIRIALNGRTFIAIPAAPGVPTGLAITATTANSITLSWAHGANSNQEILYRKGPGEAAFTPYAELGSATSFTDLGPANTGLNAGDTCSYQLRARRSKSVSALTASVTGSASATAFWLPNGTGVGNMDPAMVTVMWGANLTQATAVQVVNDPPQRIRLSGGNVTGGNAQADQGLIKHIKDPSSHTAYTVDMKFSMPDASGQWDVYIECNDFNLSGTAAATYLQFEGNQSAMRWAGKYGGTFQNFSDPAYPANLLSIARTSSSGIAWPTGTLVVGTKYGLRYEVLVNNGDGSKTINVRMGTGAQFDAGPSTLPLWGVLTLDQPRNSQIPAGYVFLNIEGSSAAASAKRLLDVWDFRVTPLTGAGL